MSIPIIAAYLRRSAAVTAITTAQRIYPIVAPQMVAPPFIVMNVVGAVDGKKIDGQDRYPVHRIQIDCNAIAAQEAWDLGAAVQTALLDIIKDTILTFKDVDVLFADVDMTDYDDARTMCRRLLQYRVRWRDA